MKRFLGQTLGALVVLGATGAVVAACAHDNSSIFVQDVLAPQDVSPGTLCVFTSQTTQATLSSGVLDLDFLDEYNPTYLVGNQLVTEVNSQQLMTETSIVNIQGAVVRITDAAGAQLNTFTRLAAGTLYPSVGGVPGYAPITVTTIDENTILADPEIMSGIIGKPLSQRAIVRLVTYVRFFGITTGGLNVESGDFEFPVDVCQGCLISFSASDVDPACPAPNCLKAGSSSSTVQAPCVPGQDIGVDCSLCLAVPDCNPVPVSACTGGDL